MIQKIKTLASVAALWLIASSAFLCLRFEFGWGLAKLSHEWRIYEFGVSLFAVALLMIAVYFLFRKFRVEIVRIK